jgi:rhomboid protease GluP
MDPVLLIIIVNAVVFILPYIIPFAGSYDSFTNFQLLGIMDKPDVRDGEWYRLLTSNYLHADVFHILVNMYSLYNVGPSIVSIFRPVGFFVIFTLSGIAGSLFSFLFNHNSGGSLGASGAIMGLLGALLSAAIVTNNSALISTIVIYVAIIGLYGFLIPQIDNWGHVGGFVAGVALGFVLLYFRAIA